MRSLSQRLIHLEIRGRRLIRTGEEGSDGKVYVAIKGVVFDVSKNSAYQPGGSYHGKENMRDLSTLTDTYCLIVFAGKDPSRGLASSSLKPEDCTPDWYDLSEEKKTVLNDWFKFFSKRYNIIGKVEGASNMDQA